MKIMVIAPHPDDETLGCGGTLFRQKQEGMNCIGALSLVLVRMQDGRKKR